MKTEYLVIEEEDMVAYRLLEKNDNLDMFYSESSEWADSVKGTKIGSLVDLGNDEGYSVVLGKKTVHLNSEEIYSLFIMLKTKFALDEHNHNIVMDKLVKTTEI